MTGPAGSDNRNAVQAFLLELTDATRTLGDPDAILASTAERLGRRLGISRVAYVELAPDAKELSHQHEWSDGVPELGTVSLDYVDDATVRALNAGETVRVADVATRWDERTLAFAESRRVASFLTVPLMKEGRQLASLSLTHHEPRSWSDAEAELAREVAERTWETLQRARAETELRAAQSNQAFLLSLGDRIRNEGDAERIVALTCEALGRHIEVGRVAFCEVSATQTGRIVMAREWAEGVPGSAGIPQDWESLNPSFRAAIEAGRSLRIEQIAKASFLKSDPATVKTEFPDHAVLAVPLLREGELVAYMLVIDRNPRRWSDAEFELVREVAERTWATLQRARAEASLRVAQSNQCFLLGLSDAIRDEADPECILRCTSEKLGRHLGVSRVGYWEIDPKSGSFLPPRQWVDGVQPVPAEGHASFDSDSVAALSRGKSLRVENVLEEGGTDRAELAANGTVAYLCVPLVKGGRYVATLSLTHHEPRRWTDGEVELVEQVADRTWSTLQRARAEAELEKSRAALYQSEKLTALGSLLAGVSHELNNPLSVVVGQALIMEQKAPDAATAARAGKIRNAAERCARIVQTFLAMARQRQPEKQSLDVNGLIEAALDLTAYGLRAAGVQVRTDFAPGLPQPVGDASQLHQLFANLFVNAQHALEDHRGRRELAVSTRCDGARVVVEVADSGPGIPAEIRSRIFEPFFTTKPVGAGTGLGLSFAYGVARAHGGELALVEEGEGTRFRVTLPLKEAPLLTATATAAPEKGHGGVALIVDDEVELAETLAEMLDGQGWSTIVAEGGRAAVEQIERRDVDIVITDLRMPGFDGADLFAWVREHRPALAERVVFLTGDTLGPGANRFLETCGRPYAEKPFSPDSIARLIEASGWRL
jgi:signal transduction histidine kinase/CheY-like chemotaxis protein